jgi:hypothetical protein
MMFDENRPLFDDEDLPGWLKEGGITYRGKEAVKFSGSGVDFAKPPWADVRPEEMPPRADAVQVPDWMHAGEVHIDYSDVTPIDPQVPTWMQIEGKPTVTQSGRLLPRSAQLRPLPPPDPEHPAPVIPVPTPEDAPPAEPTVPYESREPLPDPAIPIPPEIYDPIDVFPDVQPLEPEPEAELPLELQGDFTPAPADLDWLNAPAQGSTSDDFAQELQFNDLDNPETTSEAVPDWLRSDAPSHTYSTPTPPEVSMPEPAAPLSGNTDNDDDFRALFDQGDDLFEPSDASLELSSTPDQPDDLNLDSLLGDLPAAPPAPVARPAADLPDWMRDLPPVQPNEPVTDDFLASLSEGGAVGDLAPGDLPDWMRAAAPPEGASGATDLSGLDFLNDLSTSEESAQSGNVPDWLSGVQDVYTPDQPATPVSPSAFPATGIQPGKFQPRTGKRDTSESVDIDALLSLPLSSGESGAPSPTSAPRELTPYDLAQIVSGESERLDEVSFDDTTIDEAMGPPSDEFKFGGAEAFAPEEPEAPAPVEPTTAPSLLNRSSGRKLPAAERPPERKSAPVSPVPSPDEATIVEDLPDFVEEMRPDGAPVEMNISGVQIDVPESPITTLSDPLRQLRERSRQVGKTVAEDDAPAEGALAEIPGVIAQSAVPVSAAAVPAQIAPGTVLISDLDRRRIRTLQNLLEVEDEAEKVVQKARRRARRTFRLDRMFIAVMLFAVISVPFFTDVANIMIPPNTAPTAEQQSVFAAMDALPAGQPILVAFEYSPAGSGELDDLARVLLRDIFRKGAKPVIVSTNAIGAMHAQSLLAVFGNNPAELAALNRANQPLLARQDYYVLAYLPAGATGVRAILNGVYNLTALDRTAQFGTDIEGKPSGLNDAAVESLQRAPVIVLAETADEVRIWAEQYRRPGIQKMLFAGSVAADAAARTYTASQPASYIGPLVGLRDATTYRKLRQANGATPGEIALLDQRWQSTGLGALLAGIFILLGAAFSMIGAIRQRNRVKQETNR